MAELVDASVSKTDIREYVPVRFRPGVQSKKANAFINNALAFYIKCVLSTDCQPDCFKSFLPSFGEVFGPVIISKLS